MSRSMLPVMIRKDLRMSWHFLAAALIGGFGALMLWRLGSDAFAIAGMIAFFVVLIMLGILPMSMIVNERKKQTLAFVMSLPITAAQYAVAKLTTVLGMFLVPWLLLVGIALTLISSRADVPNGVIPLALILMLLPFIGFLITTSVAIVSESETRSVYAMAAVNVSYSFVWVAITMTPGLTRDAGGPVPVWNETVVSVLGAELAAIVLILTSTLYLQSRKRDFV
jgi:ABC-2 type transport system permease protein